MKKYKQLLIVFICSFYSINYCNQCSAAEIKATEGFMKIDSKKIVMDVFDALEKVSNTVEKEEKLLLNQEISKGITGSATDISWLNLNDEQTSSEKIPEYYLIAEDIPEKDFFEKADYLDELVLDEADDLLDENEKQLYSYLKNVDFDQDGLTDRIYRVPIITHPEDPASITYASYQLEFGNGIQTTIGDLKYCIGSSRTSFFSYDLDMDGSNEIICVNENTYNTGGLVGSYLYILKRVGNEYWKLPIPINDQFNQMRFDGFEMETELFEENFIDCYVPAADNFHFTINLSDYDEPDLKETSRKASMIWKEELMISNDSDKVSKMKMLFKLSDIKFIFYEGKNALQLNLELEIPTATSAYQSVNGSAVLLYEENKMKIVDFKISKL